MTGETLVFLLLRADIGISEVEFELIEIIGVGMISPITAEGKGTNSR